jgi:hypothetical protein
MIKVGIKVKCDKYLGIEEIVIVLCSMGPTCQWNK